MVRDGGNYSKLAPVLRYENIKEKTWISSLFREFFDKNFSI